MSKFDHYAATHELIAQLCDAGFAAEADDLRAAVEAGATGTEIFMSLRFRLTEMVTRLTLHKEAQALASRLLAELDAALQ